MGRGGGGGEKSALPNPGDSHGHVYRFIPLFLEMNHFELSSGVIMNYFEAGMILSEKSLQ